MTGLRLDQSKQVIPGGGHEGWEVHIAMNRRGRDRGAKFSEEGDISNYLWLLNDEFQRDNLNQREVLSFCEAAYT